MPVNQRTRLFYKPQMHCRVAAKALLIGLLSTGIAAAQAPANHTDPHHSPVSACMTDRGSTLDELIQICEKEVQGIRKENELLSNPGKGGNNFRKALSANNSRIYDDLETIFGAKRLQGHRDALPPVLPRLSPNEGMCGRCLPIVASQRKSGTSPTATDGTVAGGQTGRGQ